MDGRNLKVNKAKPQKVALANRSGGGKILPWRSLQAIDQVEEVG